MLDVGAEITVDTSSPARKSTLPALDRQGLPGRHEEVQLLGRPRDAR
jgi:hypothetical protein